MKRIRFVALVIGLVVALVVAGFGAYQVYQYWRLASRAESPSAVARWSMPAGTQVRLFGGDRLLISPPDDDHIIVDARTLDELHRVSADFPHPMPGPSPKTFLTLDSNVLSLHSFPTGEVISQTDISTEDVSWSHIRACPGLVTIQDYAEIDYVAFDATLTKMTELTEQQRHDISYCAREGARLKKGDAIPQLSLTWPVFGSTSEGYLLPDGTLVSHSAEEDARQKAGFKGFVVYAAKSATGWTTVYDLSGIDKPPWLLGWDAHGASTGFSTPLEGDVKDLRGDHLLLFSGEDWYVVDVHTGELLHTERKEYLETAGLDAAGNLCTVQYQEDPGKFDNSNAFFVCADIGTGDTSRVIEFPKGSRLVRFNGQLRLAWVLKTSEGVFVFN